MVDTVTPTPPVLKSGYKSTEWWLTLGTFISCGLVLAGVISKDNGDTTGAILQHVILSVSLVAGQVAVVYKYVSGRQKEKVAHANAHNRSKEATEAAPVADLKKPAPKKRVRKPRKKKNGS